MKSIKQPFNVLSEVPCKQCGRLLKANVVNRKVTATLCYSCFVAASKSTINTARDVRMRRAIGRKGGKYAPNV